LVEKPFRERRRLLHESIRSIPGELVFAESRTTSNIDEINLYLEQSVKDGCEGLMVKTLDDDATYEIAKRSHKWLKVNLQEKKEKQFSNFVYLVKKRLS
jgi:DNA ligase-1